MSTYNMESWKSLCMLRDTPLNPDFDCEAGRLEQRTAAAQHQK